MGVLVAGVGYIGAKLVQDLLQQGEKVVAIDNLFSTDLRVIDHFKTHPNFDFQLGDISDPATCEAALERGEKISAVYMLAAQASPHPEAASARYTEESNLTGPRVMLDAMRQTGVSNFVYASSFKVYGTDLPPVIDRNTPYGTFGDLSHLSKCYAEKLMEMYAQLYSIRCLSLRFGVIYGLSPVVKEDPKFMTAPNKFCLQAVSRETIDIHPSGMQVTGFMHVADASRVLRDVAESDLGSRYECFDGVSELCSVADVAEIVKGVGKEHGYQVELRLSGKSTPVRAEHRLENSVSKTGFIPKYDLRCGIREMIGYFEGRRPGQT